MMNYYELGEKLLKEISEEKGFSFRKLVKIIELSSLYNN